MSPHRRIRSFIRLALLLTLVLLVLSPASEVSSQANPNEAQVNKQFIPTIIPPGGVAKLRVFIYNPNTYPLTSASLTDNLPPGMTVANPPNAFTNCSGGTVTAVPNSTSFTLNGGTVPPKVGPVNGECYFEADITTTVQGNSVNTIPAGALSSTGPNGAVTNSTPASATLLVESMPDATVTKTFEPTTVYVGQNSTLRIRINNNSSSINMTNVSLTDALPSGLTVNGTATLSGCGTGASVTTTSNSIALTNATVLPDPDCVITVPVFSTQSNVYLNEIPANSLQSRQGVTDRTTRTATLNVQNLRVEKSFTPDSVASNGITRLRIVLRNPTSQTYTNVSFTDTLPNSGNGDLTVADPANVSHNCGGTVSIATNRASFSLSGGTIPAGTVTSPGTCIIELDVKANVNGTRTNTIPANGVTATAGTNTVTNVNPASAQLVIGPGNVSGSKAFIPSAINPGEVSRIRIRLSRSGGTSTPLTGVTFLDTLPGGVVIANPPNIAFTNCGTSAAMSRDDGPTYTPLQPGDTAFRVRNVTIPASGNCEIFVDVTSNAPGSYTNMISANSISSDQGTSNPNALSSNLTVRSGLEVTKEFIPSAITTGGYSTIRLTLTNRNTFPLTGVNLTDNLPNTGSRRLRVRSPANASTTCGGTLIANHPSTTVTLTGGSILGRVGTVPGTCTIIFDVEPFGSGSFNSGSVDNTIRPSDITTDQNITIPEPVTARLNFRQLTIRAVKEFDPTLVAGGADSLLTVTITNRNNVPLTGVNFVDTFPSGMIISSPVFTNTTCSGGVVTATAGAGSFSFSGGTIPANSSCVVQVRATINVNGNLTNVIPAGQICAKEGVCNPDPIAASLTNLPGVSISKAFDPSTIVSGGTSRLVITIRDTGGFNLTNASATDILPPGLTVASPANASTTCATGTVTTTATSITLSGATIPANGSCTFQADVTGTVPNSYVNDIPAGALTTAQGVSNTQPARATLIITPRPPAITKAFSPTDITVGTPSTLTLTISNPNTSLTLTGVAVSDTLPFGMIIADPPNVNNTCGGTLTAPVNSNTISLSGVTLSGGASCTVSLRVTVNSGGTYTNTTGNVTSTNGGTGNAASATLTAFAPPSIAKSFSPSSVPLGGVSTLTITLTNSNPSQSLNGVAFTDNLPPGMIVANSPSASNTCGITFSPSAGATALNVSGITLAPNSSCTLSVDVTTTAAGSLVNTTSSVTSTNGGTGNAATATLLSVRPPTIAKSFGTSLIPSGGTTTLALTITNPNPSIALNGVAVTDNLPSGMTIADPPINTCGGTLTAPVNSNTISLSGVTLNGGANCTLTVNVTVNAAGTYTNTTSNVTSTNGGTGNTASAVLTARNVQPPVVTKSFSPSTINTGDTATLTLTITNPNADVVLTGVSVTDNFPTNVVVASSPNISNTCGGTLQDTASGTLDAGDTGFVLSGVTLNSGASCMLTVNVTSSIAATYVNTTTNVTSTNSGTGNAASATLTVQQPTQPPIITKSFQPSTIEAGGTSELTLVITNPNAGVLENVTVSDNLPSNVSFDATPAHTGCGTNAAVSTSGETIKLVNGTIQANGTCTITISVKASVPGTYVNTTGNVTADDGSGGTLTGNAASATLTVNPVTPPILISKSFTPPVIFSGDTTTLTLTIWNQNQTTQLLDLEVRDIFPAGMSVASPPTYTNECGGTLANDSGRTLAGGNTGIQLTGGTLNARETCTITVEVTATQSGINTTTKITSTNGGEGNNASAPLTVNAVQPPVIAKSFSLISIDAGSPSRLRLTINNLNANAELRGVAVTDNFPPDMVVADPPNASGNCNGGTFTANANADSIGLTNGTIPPGGSCVLEVDVTVRRGGTYVNTTNNVTSTNGGTGNTATATLTARDVLLPRIAKSFDPTAIVSGGTSTMTITLTNPNQLTQLSSVGFTDVFPTGMTVASPLNVDNQCGGTLRDNTDDTLGAGDSGIRLTGVTLAANGSCQIRIAVTATQSGTNTTSNVGSAVGEGNNASASIQVGSRVVDVAVDIDVAPTIVATGNAIRFTIRLTNNGPNAGDGSVLSNLVPPQVLITGVSLGNATGGAVGGAPSVNGQNVTLPIPTFPVDSSLEVFVDGIVMEATDFSSTAQIATASGVVDINMSNNQDSVPVTTRTSGVTEADLVVTKSVSSAEYSPGDVLTYTIRVCNEGPNVAEGATVLDTFAATLVNPQWTCTAGSTSSSCAQGLRSGNLRDTVNIAVGTGNCITYTVTGVVASDAGVPISNTAYAIVAGGFSDPTPENNIANVLSNPRGPAPVGGLVVADPVIVKLVEPRLALPGELVVYTLTVTNPSSVPASGIVVSDTVPSVLQIIGATTTQGTFTISGQVVIFDVGVVNPSQTVVLTVQARLRDDAPAPSDVTNTGELRHRTGNPKVSSATLRVTRGRLPATGLPPAEPINLGEALLLLLLGFSLVFGGALLWLRRMRR